MNYFYEYQLAQLYPDAFAALPDAYQNDTCLEFWVGMGSKGLFARPKKDQELALGRWVCIYVRKTNTWEQVS